MSIQKVLYTSLFILFASYSDALAQSSSSANIVNNPGFEILTECPANYGSIESATGWIPVQFTPDLFHACATDPRVGVPSNYFGTQSPAEGEAYAGILLYHERSPLEMIATHFVEPMQKGEKYEVSFKISWARIYSNYACNGIGVLFTNDPSDASEISTPDIVLNELMTEDKTWTTVSKTVIAGDDYEFLVIGNFRGKEATKIYQFQRTGYPGAYYFIDDIQVKKVFNESENFIKISGKIQDVITQKPIVARIDYVLDELNYRAFEESKAEDGQYEFSYMQQNKGFYLEVKAEGYFSQRIKIGEITDSTIEQNFSLQPIEKGQSVIWNEITFQTGEAVLTKESTPSLKILAKFLQENTDFRIEIAGHTDNQGDATKNQILSQERANRVMKYLIEEGFISPKRLEAKGYGDAKPITDNETEQNRQKNRRVEIKIID